MSNILGTRLRTSREELGLTQEALANALHLSAEFISLLELGKRAPSLDTIKAIAAFFKRDVSYFLKADTEPDEKLLAGTGEDKKMRAGLQKFLNVCRDYSELEGMLGLRAGLAPLYTTASATFLARTERKRLGLGNEPIRDVFTLLERNGLHIVKQPLPEEWNVSGLFIFFDLEKSAFVLINSLQPFGRQIFIAAHEYFHYIKDRDVGVVIDNHDVFVSEYLPLYHPRERLAHQFAVHFLIPKEKIDEIIQLELASRRLDYPDVLYLKRYFGVDMMTILYALQDYGYLPASQFKEFQKKDADFHEQEVFGDVQSAEKNKGVRKRDLFSDRYRWLVWEALKKKKIDGERATRLLKSG